MKHGSSTNLVSTWYIYIHIIYTVYIYIHIYLILYNILRYFTAMFGWLKHVTIWFFGGPFQNFPFQTIGFQSFGAYMEKKIEHMSLGKKKTWWFYGISWGFMVIGGYPCYNVTQCSNVPMCHHHVSWEFGIEGGIQQKWWSISHFFPLGKMVMF